MKKLITICFFMATTFTVNAQTKEETLGYIKNIYSQINKIYDGYAIYGNVLQLDSVKLEHDNLILILKVDDLKLVRRTKISGEIKLSNDRLINNNGEEFLHVRVGNKSQLERLKNAVVHLQSFIIKDPFQN